MKMQNSKPQIKIKNYLVLVFLFGISLMLPLISQAAELYLETLTDKHNVDETFIVDIRINVEQNESINAVEAYLRFSNNILEVKDFSAGNSIFTFVEEPKIDQGKGLISFSGIIPGGYSGRVIGDPGKSNLLGKIIFQAVSVGSAEVFFQNNSEALLSDGKGTSAKLITKGVTVEIELLEGVQFQAFPKDEWQEELEKDKIPPENFKPEIVKINNKYYVTFITKDKGSGMDYYDVLEKPQAKSLLRSIIAKWVQADSPYLLKDQSLSSHLEVKAVDKAGNERIVELAIIDSESLYEDYFLWIIIILVILSCLSFKLWSYLKIRK